MGGRDVTAAFTASFRWPHRSDSEDPSKSGSCGGNSTTIQPTRRTPGTKRSRKKEDCHTISSFWWFVIFRGTKLVGQSYTTTSVLGGVFLGPELIVVVLRCV